jgi:hypothetical protein
VLPALPEAVVVWGTFTLTKRILILGLYSISVIAAAFLMIARKTPLIGQKIDHTTNGKLALYGAGIGGLTGLIGLGGGFLIMPVLCFVRKIPFTKAVGTTLTIISLKSLIGFLGDLATQPVQWLFLLSISAISVAGMFVGTKSASALSNDFLKVSFGWFILVLGITVLLREGFFKI